VAGDQTRPAALFSKRSLKPSYFASSSQPGLFGQSVVVVATIGSEGTTFSLLPSPPAARRLTQPSPERTRRKSDPVRAVASARMTVAAGIADRADERRRAAALARHYRDHEDLSIREIAVRLGRAPATVKAYLWDPTGEKTRAVKRRYQGACRSCGAPTTARGGKGDAYEYCKRCHPGATGARRTQQWVREAMEDWQVRYGSLPSSSDWSRTHARRRGDGALERFEVREWSAPSTVIGLYGSWAAAVADAHQSAD
jgi:hypothetical protein